MLKTCEFPMTGSDHPLSAMPPARWGTRGFTLVEIVLAILLFFLMLLAVYKLFFAEIRTIRSALEHLGVNENCRKFLTRFGDDVRNANRVLQPVPVPRKEVQSVNPVGEGVFAVFESQAYDFSKKPPDPKMIKTMKISYSLKKDPKDGTWDIFRTIDSEGSPFPGGPSGFKATAHVAGGLKEIKVFTSIRSPVKFSSFPGLPFKNTLVFEPYDSDGTGPNLIHVRATFIRKGNIRPGTKEESALTIRTSFAVRGKSNLVNP